MQSVQSITCAAILMQAMRGAMELEYNGSQMDAVTSGLDGTAVVLIQVQPLLGCTMCWMACSAPSCCMSSSHPAVNLFQQQTVRRLCQASAYSGNLLLRCSNESGEHCRWVPF